jgi:hypothetical protein
MRGLSKGSEERNLMVPPVIEMRDKGVGERGRNLRDMGLGIVIPRLMKFPSLSWEKPALFCWFVRASLPWEVSQPLP